jgi:hypothetical protein
MKATSRRNFLKSSLASASLTASVSPYFAACSAKAALPRCSITTLTSGSKHHFFGYYGIPPWNLSGSRMVCLEADFQDHMPKPEEAARVGLVNPETGAFKPVAETHAWNFQQGAMLHWNPLNPEAEVLFNDLRDGVVVSAVLNVDSSKTRFLSRPVSAVCHRGKLALSLTYGRLNRLRKVTGYSGAVDPHPDQAAPEDDGVFLLDLETGHAKLIVSFAQVQALWLARKAVPKDRHIWIDHVVFNRNDTRFFLLPRTWSGDGKRLETGMFTAKLDGSDLREVIPYGSGVSHFDWRNDREIIATFNYRGATRHVLFTDGKSDYNIVGEEVLAADGHCSFAPDAKWIATDRNHQDKAAKSLWIYNVETKEHAQLGLFPVRQYLSGDLRCDLHARWSRDGKALCFDTLEQTGWTRQLHLAQLAF